MLDQLAIHLRLDRAGGEHDEVDVREPRHDLVENTSAVEPLDVLGEAAPFQGQADIQGEGTEIVR